MVADVSQLMGMRFCCWSLGALGAQCDVHLSKALKHPRCMWGVHQMPFAALLLLSTDAMRQAYAAAGADGFVLVVLLLLLLVRLQSCAALRSWYCTCIISVNQNGCSNGMGWGPQNAQRQLSVAY